VNRYSELSLSADRGNFVTSRPETRVSIWVGDTSGEGREVVTAAPFLSAAAVYATVGWDGPRVLFTHTLNGRFEIFRTMADGSGAPEVIVAGRDFAAAPDGHIVYRSLTGTDVGLWRVDRDGRNPLQLAPGSVNFPMVTRDGNEVVFSSPASGQQTVWRIPLAGGSGSPLVNEAIGLAGFSDVSPDGHSIAMFRGGGWAVCDYPACTQKTPIQIRGQFVRWVPDGTGLSTVIQDNAGNSNVWIQPLDGSAPRQVTHFTDGKFIGQYAWSNDGQRIAVSRVSFSSDIVLFRNLPRSQ
jgi:dipeptidyl aminopeptidase/acylaminoacyl peptidase